VNKSLGTMTDHQRIFLKIKDLLSNHVTLKTEVLDYGTHLEIDEGEIWIQSDPNELTIGYGFSHIHYNPTHDNLRKGIERLFNLLTKRKRVTSYFKGDKIFKERTEIELQEGKFEHFGTTMKWLFPFWRRTTKEMSFQPPLIEFHKVENELKEIYKLL
jgi:hypothetical protein